MGVQSCCWPQHSWNKHGFCLPWFLLSVLLISAYPQFWKYWLYVKVGLDWSKSIVFVLWLRWEWMVGMIVIERALLPWPVKAPRNQLQQHLVEMWFEYRCNTMEINDSHKSTTMCDVYYDAFNKINVIDNWWEAMVCIMVGKCWAYGSRFVFYETLFRSFCIITNISFNYNCISSKQYDHLKCNQSNWLLMGGKWF